MTSQAYLRVTDALDARGSRASDRRQGHAVYQCSAHEDRTPSLSVDDKGDRVMVFCHAGCHTDDVVASLGLALPDLFDTEPEADQAQIVRSYVYKGTRGEIRYVVDRLWPKSFRSRRPDAARGQWGGVTAEDAILYHADSVWQCMKNTACTVYVVDGEKDVETAERYGLVATCPPGFGKKWKESYTRFLTSAAQVVIVADQDTIKPDGTLGKGQAFAIEARNALRAHSVKVRVVAPAVGKDLTDHFEAGYTEADFQVEPTASIRVRGMTAHDLGDKHFEPINFAVEGILPSGLTIFAGSPKAGKSWVALDMCLAVALGGPAMSYLQTEQGCALYLAREDNYRRLQSRMRLIMEDGALPPALEVIPQEHEWPGGEEGLAYLTEWAEECGTPRLVVLDTIAKVEPDMGEDPRRGAYAGNYSMMSRYKQWADQHNCAVVAVHHDRKQAAGAKTESGMDSDPFTRISGTRGLTGAADTLWFLETVRGKGEGYLHVTGRDVVEQTIELRKAGPLWTATTVPE